MKGIQFVTDDAGEKTAVLIDLKRYSDTWEDFYDHVLAHARQQEPREALVAVKARLIRQGKLRG